MRLVALVLLCMVVAVHHGVPMLGHEVHAAAHPAAGAGHGAHGQQPSPDDAGVAIGTCLAVMVVAAMAAAARIGRRPFAVRRAHMRARWLHLPMVAGPPAHGPPRPIRPCVLLR